MSDHSVTELIRRKIRRLFEQCGVAADQPIHETLLVRGGYFCGRRFHCGGMNAVWFIEENQIKLYGDDGKLLTVRNAWDETSAVERAA
ncbi:MAG: hypothetical protein KatS3mg110_0897 [Pirellulaceae bacterium]|nr:MAG: hypothetical protein KatS3mg110_0897 [Pirellulaceae bacterium]